MSEVLRRAFLEDLAAARDWATKSARDSLRGEFPVWSEHPAAFELLRSKLTSHEDADAFAAAVQDFVHIALHSVLVAVDGGSASAEVGRVRLVDVEGRSLGDGLHELFVEHLFETGRME